MSKSKQLGLVLSGSGYRAAAYHLGTLKKLHEFGILSHLDVLYAISGGSITAAFYCLNKYDFSCFEASLYHALQTKVSKKKRFSNFLFFALSGTAIIATVFYFIHAPQQWTWLLLSILSIAGLIVFSLYKYPFNKKLEDELDSIFYKGATLAKLTSSPELLISCTNQHTAGPFNFSRAWMQDLAYQWLTDKKGNPAPVQFNHASFPVARAVTAASSGAVQSKPVRIDKKYFRNPERDFARVKPRLVDTGLLNNQGIANLIQSGPYNCVVILNSDAGNFEDINEEKVYENNYFSKKKIVHISLQCELENCIPAFIEKLEKKQIPSEVTKALHLHRDWVENPAAYYLEILEYLYEITGYERISKPSAAELHLARCVPAGLSCLSRIQIDCLMKQASAITELQLKLYCPEY